MRINQVSGGGNSPSAGVSAPIIRQNSLVEASLCEKCTGTIKRLPSGLVQELIRGQAALSIGVEAVGQSPPGLALHPLNRSSDASTSYAAVAARSPSMASVSSEGTRGVFPRSQGPDVESFGIESHTEELRFDILPTIEISARGFIFINGARSNGRTIMDWLKRPTGLDSRTTEEVETPQCEPDWMEITVESGTYTTTYPFTRTRCVACAELFSDLKSVEEHVEKKHEGTVSFACSKCGKKFPKRNRIAIHYGKCKGGIGGRSTEINREEPDLGVSPVETQNRFEALTQRQETVADSADYACEVCQERFQAKRGLGQHIRHRHPDLANQKRIDAVEADIERKRRARREEAAARASGPPSRQSDKPKKGILWTPEETDLLVALNIKYHGERYINKAIEKEMNGKTSKQISDKRRAMGLIDSDPKSKPARASTRATAPKRQAGGSRTSETGIEQLEHEPEVRDMRPLFREAIELEGPCTLVGDSAETLLRAVRDDASYQETEKIVIDLLKERCKPPENKRPKRKMDKVNQKGKPPKGKKAKEKAKQFRTDQYLFENDRKALSKRLLDGKETDAKCNLDPKVVEQTYQERFGGVSQEVDLSNYPPAEKVDNNELLRPFTSKTVKAAMRKAKKNTAAGPDKIDLKKLLTVDRQGKTLTNLFNTWLLTGHVPEAVKENRSILLPKGTEGLDNINNWRPLCSLCEPESSIHGDW